MQTCGELLAKYLDAYGIEVAFGIPGTHTIELYRGLPKTNIRHVTPRHEQGAGFMADGYARVTGKPAACITVSGPGALNISGAMGQALQDSQPMLVISADNNTWQRGLGEGRLHETRNLQAAMAESARWAHTLTRPDELPKVMARTFAIFASERPGPVHLTLPLDVITAPADHVALDIWPLPARPAPAASAIAEAAALLNKAKRPLLALGGGCADAQAQTRALVDALQAPVSLTHNAKGLLPPDHPLLLGSNPSFASIRHEFEQADVVLAIGTELSETDYDFFFKGDFKIPGQLIRVDIDTPQLTRNCRPALAIQSDSAAFMAALTPHIKADRLTASQARVASAKDKHLSERHAGYQAFLDCLLDTLPDAIIMGDSTQPAYYAANQFDARAPRSFGSAATGYGTLGWALPAAFGARLGAPQRPVIGLLGDGGVQFSLNELATAVEAQIPVALIIWHNSCYEMIAMNFRDAGMAPMACDIYSPDFIKVAEGYGCRATRAQDLASLARALRDAQDADVPTIIEVQESDFI
ncbi:5-guanidino-2-oxopentanoate decarboxylase [Simiduia aestuariiviva]|uniref:Acetolactate synthase-1/2/3 large subunit n=1 Tax=Simiduia aestuariiviva TaxID=1510459 RepID=A0A839UP63_9GAMM|nr:5-guanidino-2-oxopentanoate decarboxylase [Simiduia aestuariiviva]MBB3169543.1 acetolactate synthase-1/2/3 large subunit [Simiduia aestuariiviva]